MPKDIEESLVDWPDAPLDGRPVKLPVNRTLADDEVLALEGRGWVPVDIRTLPNNTVDERREAVGMALAAIRLGLKVVSTNQLRAIELEARTLGLLGKDAVPDKPKGEVVDVLAAIQAFTFRSKG